MISLSSRRKVRLFMKIKVEERQNLIEKQWLMYLIGPDYCSKVLSVYNACLYEHGMPDKDDPSTIKCSPAYASQLIPTYFDGTFRYMHKIKQMQTFLSDLSLYTVCHSVFSSDEFKEFADTLGFPVNGIGTEHRALLAKEMLEIESLLDSRCCVELQDIGKTLLRVARHLDDKDIATDIMLHLFDSAAPVFIGIVYDMYGNRARENKNVFAQMVGANVMIALTS